MINTYLGPQMVARPLGHVRIAVDAAVGLGTVPAGARYALIQSEAQVARMRDDGTAPTITTGLRVLTTLEPLVIGQHQFGAIQFIGEAVGGFVNVAYYGGW